MMCVAARRGLLASGRDMWDTVRVESERWEIEMSKRGRKRRDRRKRGANHGKRPNA